MSAHRQVTDIVKEDYTSGAGSVFGLNQQRADDDIRAARLIYDSRAKVVELLLKAGAPGLKRPQAQIRSALDDHPSRFTRGVRIDHLYLPSSCAHKCYCGVTAWRCLVEMTSPR